MRAIGLVPSLSARSARATTRAAAPSLIPLALPAVTVPSALKAGLRRANDSAVVPGRGCSSVSTRVVPFFPATSTGTISSSKAPASIAAAARRWLSAASASWSTREMP